MLNLFFDTSALVKIFHKEAGSDAVTELIQRDNVKLWISELTRLELISALHRRYRMGEINENQLKEVCNIIDEVLKQFQIELVGSGVFYEAENLMRTHAKEVGLRTLDALHLATFRLISKKNWKFIVADRVLLKAATNLKMQVLNPLE